MSIRSSNRPWQLAAEIDVTAGQLITFDPFYYDPDWADPNHDYNLALDGSNSVSSVTVYLKRVDFSQGDWRNVAAKIVFTDKNETDRVKVGEVGVDSAMLAIASADALPRMWQVGGSKSKNSLWVPFLPEVERIEEGRAARKHLAENGFSFALQDAPSWLHEFLHPLSDGDIAMANLLLKQAGIRSHVNTFIHHSTAIIIEQLSTKPFAYLEDNGKPYLVAFYPGWGDDDYDWFALKHNDEVIGFLCEMIVSK